MHLSRTRFKKEIVAEFLPPRRAPSTKFWTSRGKSPNKKLATVIILCGGMPTVPNKKELMEFLARKGYWVFFPRYRGSWESEGRFLKRSPEQDIRDVINELPKGFRDAWSGVRYKVNPQEIILIGSSFGGPAAILLSKSPQITKVIALSPVVDWRVKSKAEPIDQLERFVRDAFGNGYRYSHTNWQKLKTGTFYNPMTRLNEIDGKRIFIIHAKDDDIVDWKSVKKFANLTGARLWLKPTGGHLSQSNLMKPSFYRKINKFLSTRQAT